MKHSNIYIAALAATALSAIAPGAALADSKVKNWHYRDGTMAERWSLDSRDYALCDSGLAQSPIDLGGANARGAIEMMVNYGPASGKMVLGEQKVQVNFAPGQAMGLSSGATPFKLLQLHFHTPSEHAVNGQRLPLEGHLVHASEHGELAVLGILFTEGKPNPALTQILAAQAEGNGAPVRLDIMTLLPRDPGVYRYMGSLTTPPCSEGVNWYVAKLPVEASAQQIAALRKTLGSSARSLQPRGNRLVVEPSRGASWSAY